MATDEILQALLESSLRVEALLVASIGTQSQSPAGMPPSWRRRMAEDNSMEVVTSILTGEATAQDTAVAIQENRATGGPQ
jgi:hypothetical protein